ncbi:MAG: hypothetical protein IJR17_05880 [Clostridia bacterium]|nr:hypothetical protein [Clostridia bacterium]
MNRRLSLTPGRWLARGLFLLLLVACGKTLPPAAAPEPTATPAAAKPTLATEEDTEPMLQLQINGQAVTVAWESNEAVEALQALCAREPLILSTSRYGGFEQVGPIGTTLPAQDRHTQTEPGDIMLYASDQIVVFFGSNSWAYTPLGRITDPDTPGLCALLDTPTATLTFTLQ